LKRVDYSHHIIICGWNFQGERIIQELLASSSDKDKCRIVILANQEKRPTKEERVDFVKGDPTQDEALIRAGVKVADSVIVMSDLNKNANEADAETLMIVLAVESLNREVHTCVQLLNSSNRMHLERAHADEIICLDQIGGNLVVASALHHGVSRIVRDLLTFNEGSEFYRFDKPLPEHMVGKEFHEAVMELAQKKILLIAFETDYTERLYQQLQHNDVVYRIEEEERMMVINPQSRYKLKPGDVLFVVAESEPYQL
jgi:voltage-gated potassium channel